MTSRLRQPLPWVLGTSILLNAIAWAVAIFLFPRSGPAAILHYNAAVGVDFIGESRQIYVLPALGAVILGGNFLLGSLLRNSSRRAAALLWATIPAVQAILVASIILLWQFNR